MKIRMIKYLSKILFQKINNFHFHHQFKTFKIKKIKKNELKYKERKNRQLHQIKNDNKALSNNKCQNN